MRGNGALEFGMPFHCPEGEEGAIKCHMQRAGPRGPFMRNVCMQGQDSAVALMSKGAREYFICKSSPFSTLFAL